MSKFVHIIKDESIYPFCKFIELTPKSNLGALRFLYLQCEDYKAGQFIYEWENKYFYLLSEDQRFI